MTLIAALHPNECPVLLGDLLISADRPKDGAFQISRPVGLPTVGFVLPADHNRTHEIVATRQKLCIVTDNIMIGWSGPYPVAERIVLAMRDHFTPGPVTNEAVAAFFTTCEYDDLFRSRLKLVGIAISDTRAERFGFNVRPINLPCFGPRCYVAGQGAPSLIALGHGLERVVPPSPEHHRSVALAQTLLATGMLIGDELLTRQSIDVHRFGGFYEIVLPSDGGVRKVGRHNVCFLGGQFSR
jgi:hypothetical protein